MDAQSRPNRGDTPPQFRRDRLGIRLKLRSAEMLFTNVLAGDFAEPSDDSAALIESLSGIDRGRWAQAEQVHGIEIEVTSPEQDLTPFGSVADGQVTARRDVLCAVRTADCLPVLLAGDHAVAALHAGWRGLDAGIIEAGAESLRALDDGEVIGVIGPGARGCCYEVGDELRATFSACPEALCGSKNLDLAVVASHLLSDAGVTTIHDCGICTICSSPDEFFSYRRDDGKTGRMLGAIWRN